MQTPRCLQAAGARLILLLLLLLAVCMLPAADGFRLSSSSSIAHRRPLPWGGVMGQQPAGHHHTAGRPRAPTTAVRMAAEEGESTNRQQPTQRQLQQQHTRRAALGLVLGPLAMAVGAGSAAAGAAGIGEAAGAAAGVSAHKSAQELKFELMKLGLDLTHAFKFEEAEAVYSDLVDAFGTPLMLSDREKGLLAKAYSNRGNVVRACVCVLCVADQNELDGPL